MKKLSMILCFINIGPLAALTCPEGSNLENDDNYIVICEDDCPDGYTKVIDDPSIVKFEVTSCSDSSGTFDAICPVQ